MTSCVPDDSEATATPCKKSPEPLATLSSIVNWPLPLFRAQTNSLPLFI